MWDLSLPSSHDHKDTLINKCAHSIFHFNRKCAMATPEVIYDPNVIRDHVIHGYLTTSISFRSFSPIVQSPYFLRVILVVTSQLKLVEEELPQYFQSQSTKDTEVLKYLNVNHISVAPVHHKPKDKKLPPRSHGKRPTNKTFHRTIRINNLCVYLNGKKTTTIKESVKEHVVAKVSTTNKFGIFTRVSEAKPKLMPESKRPTR